MVQIAEASAPASGKPQTALVLAELGQTLNTQYLIFTLGGESFAIGILSIKEIIEFGQLTEVPMMPTVVRGVINLRGAVVPVIDLAVRFGRPPTKVARRTCIVIIELINDDVRMDVGIVVDSVNEVIDILKNDIEAPPSFGARIRTDFIAGMGKVNGNFVIILDVIKVLSFEEIESMSNFGENPSPIPREAEH
ncbi:chemotaxis protein CheW [Uliginosibacterium gangwonense]|uniref:chemotaxis protein CheW n=1 Tax=Uliginosibacterium gangwonense TaxID=392736 RepID=UPI00036F51E5|nr:chemotaxis protein CheW [Uliginosibacterium gangwonense]